MSDNNRNLRVRANINGNENNVSLKLDQDIDNIDILSLSISTGNFYKYHTSDYGCLVGRVIANGGIGVPNARISLFVQADNNWLDENILSDLYPYTSVVTKNSDGIRYNVLPEEVVSKCHTPVGTMPSKRMLLDDSNILEIYENFYKFTTVTNNAGDYMLFGIPTGDQIIHMDLDLSDCGYLSQRPRDMMYKGYNIDMFENANKFKKSDNIDGLPQIISQNNSIYIYPFWSNDGESEAKITRNDISVNYQFIPTCVFIGSIVSDEESSSLSEKCIPAERMGQMNRLMTGSGRIEMIRKNANGAVEEFQVQGTELIDGNGTWCYQIPMNLDYVKTDEYGNLVPSEDPNIGIATRTRVRFRVSLSDYESDYGATHIVKMLVPNNPKTYEDYEDTFHFGSKTSDNEEGTKSFRDLFWNNVYTVKSYIPRIQKGNRNRNRKFSGFKMVNIAEGKNQIPYNNLRVRLTFMFVLQCAIMKVLLWLMGVFNKRLLPFAYNMKKAGGIFLGIISFGISAAAGVGKNKKDLKCLTIGDGVCPDLDGWYFAPKCTHSKLFSQTWDYLLNDLDTDSDKKSVDYINKDKDEPICLTNEIDYLTQCIEINLAQEYEVIKFDFYNDWINGLIYIPRWTAKYRKKKTLFFGLIKRKAKTLGCFDYSSESPFKNTRRMTQQCSLEYKEKTIGDGYYSEITNYTGCHKKKEKCHKTPGRNYTRVFNGNIKAGGGLCHIEETMKGEKAYYFKPCEFHKSYDGTYENRIIMFATDLVLLGSLNECDENGIPIAFKYLPSTSYKMPSNLAGTNIDNEGYMYSYGQTKQSICKNKKIEEPLLPLTGSSQTLGNFVNWSKTIEEYEKVPDDITEYAVTESAGIDWGWTGPNQGVSNSSIPYYPGGHFLGISCVNAQTNIKTCVNLSRVCEVGAEISSRNYVLLKNKENVEFAYTQPTGFISKDELSDSQFRTMFATMNINGLKTVVDNDTNYRKYEFISNVPTNFGGEFEKYTDNEYYNKINSRSDKGSDISSTDAYLFTRTFEYRSDDYYRFRFGLIDEPDSKDMRKHYALRNGSIVAMPMYENSFYFYFGLVNGSTSLERLFRDYFSNCESNDEDASFFTYSTGDADLCKTDTGTFTVEFNNVESPYMVSISDSDGNSLYFKEMNSGDGSKSIYVDATTTYYYYIYKKNDGDSNDIFEAYDTSVPYSDSQKEILYSTVATAYTTNSKEITINGLVGSKNGKGYSVKLSSTDGQYKVVEISVGLATPDIFKHIICIGSDYKKDVQKTNSLKWKTITYHVDQYAISGDTSSLSALEDYGYVQIFGENGEANFVKTVGGEGIIGYVIATDSTFTSVQDSDLPDNFVRDEYCRAELDNESGYVDGITPLKYLAYASNFEFNDDDINNKIYLWDDNDEYDIYAAYTCNKPSEDNTDTVGETRFVLIGEITLKVQKALDIYITDEDLLYNETIKPLIDAGICTRTNWWGYMMVTFSGITSTAYVKKDGSIDTGATEFTDDIIAEVTPKQIWNIKRAFYYQKTVHDMGTSESVDILVGPTGGVPPYKEILFGAMERVIDYDDGDEDTESYSIVETTVANKAFINDPDTVKEINLHTDGTPAIYVGDAQISSASLSFGLRGFIFPTLGVDFAVGNYNGDYGYGVNEKGTNDYIHYGVLAFNRNTPSLDCDSFYQLSAHGSKCFYSRQLVSRYGNPRWTDGEEKEEYYKSGAGGLYMTTESEMHNGNLKRITEDKSKRMHLGFLKGNLSPKWGPKIHYGVRYEDSLYCEIEYANSADTNGTLVYGIGEVPIKNGNKKGRGGGKYKKNEEFIGGTYWDAYDKSSTPNTWHNPDERFFLTLPSIYAPFFFNTVFIIEGPVDVVSDDAAYHDNVTPVEEVVQIDFGLQSGILWSKYCVGAINVQDGGTSFAWAETETRESFDDESFETKPHRYGNDPEYTRYCGDSSHGLSGFTDDVLVLYPFDDAASENYGAKIVYDETDTARTEGTFVYGWRTPTIEEFKELFNSENTEMSTTTINKQTGILIRGRGDYSNNSIFLPNGTYWTSEIEYTTGGTNTNPTCVIINATSGGTISINYESVNRNNGYYVRPIYVSGEEETSETTTTTGITKGVSIRCKFRITGGITYPEVEDGTTKFKFDRISAKISGSEGTVNIILDEKNNDDSHEYDDFYRTDGDFPNKKSTVLNIPQKGDDGKIGFYSEDICYFNGMIENPENGEFSNSSGLSAYKNVKVYNGANARKERRLDMDMYYTFPFDLGDCMYDAMPMIGWRWDKGDDDDNGGNVGGSFGPFDSFNDSYTSGESRTWAWGSEDTETNSTIYRTNGTLADLVNGGSVTLSFEVADAVPPNSDGAPFKEIESRTTVKFFNMADGGDSGNIRYFFLGYQQLYGKGSEQRTPFYENVHRSFTYYGYVYNSFVRWDELRRGSKDRLALSIYHDSESYSTKYGWFKPDKSYVYYSNDLDPNSTATKPLFSGIYSSTFLDSSDAYGNTIHVLDDFDQEFNRSRNSGLRLADIDYAVNKWYEDNTDENGKVPEISVYDIFKAIGLGHITPNSVYAYSGAKWIGINDPFMDNNGNPKAGWDNWTIWDSLPKDTSMVSAVRVYDFNDFMKLLIMRYETKEYPKDQ